MLELGLVVLDLALHLAKDLHPCHVLVWKASNCIDVSVDTPISNAIFANGHQTQIQVFPHRRPCADTLEIVMSCSYSPVENPAAAHLVFAGELGPEAV